MSAALGRLERVELRNIWETEDQHFTPWLAQEDNLQVLADTLKMELELEAQEKNVGPFRADILCKNTDDGSWVLIENQLERTDHGHLGQLMTYASGLNAVTIIWIADRFTEEHRSALDWLNDITDEHFRFFGLEVELWKIGDSPAAPKFNVVSKPNDWTRSISKASKAISETGLTDTKRKQQEFWAQLKAQLEECESPIRMHKPMPQHWMNIGIGRSGFLLCPTLNTKEKRIGVELQMNDEDAKAYFSLLKLEKENVEKEIGHELEWKELPERKSSRIILFKHGVDPLNTAVWPEYRQWFVDKLELFNHVFRNRIKVLDTAALEAFGLDEK
jgi:hypothetical protein